MGRICGLLLNVEIILSVIRLYYELKLEIFLYFSDHKRKLPYDVIVQLAHAVLDGTVFEIAKGLQDIQALTEKNMFEKRSKLVNEQRGEYSISKQA